MYQSADNHQERHIIIFKEKPAQAFILEAAAYSIGRDETNAIVLNSPSISRQHALLLRLPDGDSQHQYSYRLVDGNIEGQTSKNGTFINGTACSSGSLKDGDLITFGTDVQAAYAVLSHNDFGSSLDILQTIQFHSIKVNCSNGKETIVSEVLDLHEIETQMQPNNHQPRRPTFQIVKRFILRVLFRRVF